MPPAYDWQELQPTSQCRWSYASAPTMTAEKALVKEVTSRDCTLFVARLQHVSRHAQGYEERPYAGMCGIRKHRTQDDVRRCDHEQRGRPGIAGDAKSRDGPGAACPIHEEARRREPEEQPVAECHVAHELSECPRERQDDGPRRLEQQSRGRRLVYGVQACQRWKEDAVRRHGLKHTR